MFNKFLVNSKSYNPKQKKFLGPSIVRRVRCLKAGPWLEIWSLPTSCPLFYKLHFSKLFPKSFSPLFIVLHFVLQFFSFISFSLLWRQLAAFFFPFSSDPSFFLRFFSWAILCVPSRLSVCPSIWSSVFYCQHHISNSSECSLYFVASATPINTERYPRRSISSVSLSQLQSTI